MKVVCIKEHAGGCQEAGGSLYLIEERIDLGDEGDAYYDGRRWVLSWHGGWAWSMFDTDQDMAQYARPVGVSSDTPKKDDKR